MQISSPDARQRPEWKGWDTVFKDKLGRLEPVLAGREWLADSFSIADIAMSDVLRLPERFDGLADHPARRAYVARVAKAPADQLAHFAAAD
jgi:glutathione S-transferase